MDCQGNYLHLCLFSTDSGSAKNEEAQTEPYAVVSEVSGLLELGTIIYDASFL